MLTSGYFGGGGGVICKYTSARACVSVNCNSVFCVSVKSFPRRDARVNDVSSRSRSERVVSRAVSICEYILYP